MEQHIFQQFFGPQQAQNPQQIPEYMIHNELIMEIINNWQCVLEVMKKFREGNLKQVDSLEHTWINFFIKNKIEITQYKNEDEFRNAFWRIP